MKTDVLIIGSGVAGLYCAINLPSNKKITIITKSDLDKSDSLLAQGGICVQREKNDFESYFNDTLKAGHFENRAESVKIMINSSNDIINDLINFGVEFERKNGEYCYTREGGHSKPRILFHKDITGREITNKLISKVKQLKNVNIISNLAMVDIISAENTCYGIISRKKNGQIITIESEYTILASGGIGGLFKNSTNFPHLTGDAIAIAKLHNIEVENADYIQIHPTTLYSVKPDRRFLISESVRGEGAVLLNHSGKRFVNELLPRDKVTAAIREQMNIEGSSHVYLSLKLLSKDTILNHFPNIYEHCLLEGYNILNEPIPVVPAQHYFMGGIHVDIDSRTTMKRLFAIGETCCNGVHGANRLASNSLLESLVFAKRAAVKITSSYCQLNNQALITSILSNLDLTTYRNYDKLQNDYQNIVKKEIERMQRKHEQPEYNEIKHRQPDYAGIA